MATWQGHESRNDCFSDLWPTEREALLHELVVFVLALRSSPTPEKGLVASIRGLLDDGFADVATSEIRSTVRSAIENETYRSLLDGTFPRLGRTGAKAYFHTLPPTTFQAKREAQVAVAELIATLAEDESGETDSDETGIGRSLKHDMLSAETIARLSRLQSQGDRSARNAMVVHNLRLVKAVSHGQSAKATSDLDEEDLFQEGAIGALRAAEKFDPDRAFAFSTYATWWIRQQASRAAADKGRSVRVPVHVVERITLADLAGKYLTDPDQEQLAEIAAFAELPDGVRSAPGIIFHPKSLDFLTDEEEESFLPDVNAADAFEWIDRTGFTVEEMLMDCSPIQIEILAGRLGLISDDTLTLDALGQVHHVTRERIRQIESSGLKAARLTLERLQDPSTQIDATVRSKKIKQVRSVLERVRENAPSTQSHSPD